MICELPFIHHFLRLSFLQLAFRFFFLPTFLVVCFGFTAIENVHRPGIAAHEIYISEAGAADSSSYVMLHWKITKNEQIDHFEIERMDINGQYKTIGLILSDDDAKTNAYLFKDRITVRDLHLFYRIRVIDRTGRVFFSNILPLELKSAGKERIGISYNNNNMGIGLVLPSLKGNYVCRMYNRIGEMVKLKYVTTSNNQVDINDLGTGSYFMELYHPKTGKRFYTQFSKQ